MKLVLAILLAGPAAFAQIPAPAAPDTLYIHGNILTGAHLKPSDPSTTPHRLLHTRVLRTIVNGESVYTAP